MRLVNRIRWILISSSDRHDRQYDDCAAEREQAPSPRIAYILGPGVVCCRHREQARSHRGLVVGADCVITSRWSTMPNLWRGSLLPLGCAAASKRPAHSYRKAALPLNESMLPDPESRALRRLVYSPSATLPPSYESLRHCLQLRQNPPACAPCPWVLSFPCHCPSVVGFSSPEVVTVA